MKGAWKVLLAVAAAYLLASCARPVNYLEDYPPRRGDATMAVIEIPAGTLAKWEVMKPHGNLEWEVRDGKPRVVQYLAYPANYGMVPGTVMAAEDGGDGDPLDVIVLGPTLPRGSVHPVRVVGVMWAIDGGERDDKLLAVHPDSPFAGIRDIGQLDAEFPGVTDILRTWFENYKGPGRMVVRGFGDAAEAEAIVDDAARR